MRDFQLPGRSTVHAMNGMAATSNPLATLAALDILRAGGNAVDGAVAACAVQCVVEPMSTGVGGDCFALYVPRGKGEVIGLNGSGWAPSALTSDHLLQRGIDRIGTENVHAVTVPGAVDAWSTLLSDHGTMGLDRVLQAAIGYAEQGWAVSPRVATDWDRNVKRLAGDEGATMHYLKNGRAPRVGETWRSPALARTLRTIAEKGREGFYAGWVAEDIVSYLTAKGGTHAQADFAEQRAEYVRPISTGYKGHAVHQIPPNGQGITALMMLNILCGFDLPALDPLGADRLHLETEAARLAFATRDRYVADMRHADVPVAKMLSPAFADEMRARIDRARAMAAPEMTGPAYRDTIYLTVVDRDQNACSFINSLFFPFGACITAPKSGVTLQNRGSGFRVDPAHPNNVAPRKRPMHTIIPGMCMQDGRVKYSYGVMGGGYQPVGHVHILTNMIDYGMDPQEALDCPRVFHMGGKLDVERGLGDAVMEGLAAKGHTVGRPEMPWGGGQVIEIDWRAGTLVGGSDPRKDGCALGY
jgi:gamma-glutamyltranspeptidase/glutathione hydrolase